MQKLKTGGNLALIISIHVLLVRKCDKVKQVINATSVSLGYFFCFGLLHASKEEKHTCGWGNKWSNQGNNNC
jgi:hypothetical protein